MEIRNFTEDDIPDEDVEKLTILHDELREMLKPEFIHEYVARYIFLLYKYGFAQKTLSPFRNHINSCIDDFNCVRLEEIDFKKLKLILIEKYKLKVIKEEPYLELEEI